MRKLLNPSRYLLGLLGLLIVLSSSLTFAQENLATTLENRDIDRYKQQAERMAQGDVDLLWVGDSITHFWENAGKEVWEKYYGNRKAMNFAISGDRTGHVLWRMANSPMDKISPKMTVVMIGANMVITPIFMGVPASVVWSLMPFIAGFNAIKAGINGLVTFLVYKRISGFLHKQ